MTDSPLEKTEIAENLATLTGLPFTVIDGKIVALKGSDAGYQRFNYLCQNYGDSLRALISGDNDGIEVVEADRNLLERLAAREPERRAEADEVAQLLSNITGLEWGWNGYYYHVPYNISDKSIPPVIFRLEREGVIVGEGGFSMCLNGQEELEIQNVDLKRLRAKAAELTH